jgi:antitoxin (DNA-binding transcriptional repressor) of toxin-antitoxin stability system
MLDEMKTLTTREFFHSPGLVKALRPGQSIIVTDHGKPALTVTKAGQRPRKTRAVLEREAAEISPEANPKVNFAAALRDLKAR